MQSFYIVRGFREIEQGVARNPDGSRTYWHRLNDLDENLRLVKRGEREDILTISIEREH